MKAVHHRPSERPLPSLPLYRHGVPGFANLMTEYLVAQVINAERKFYFYYDSQRAGRWEGKGDRSKYRVLSELTIGILGVGRMGKDAAERFKAFGCRTVGLVRRVPAKEDRCQNIDKYVTLDSIGELLSKADYLCNVLPNTPETTGILNNGVLECCSGTVNYE